MSQQPRAVFLISLVQDVNVVRPLVFMAARDFRLPTLLLVSTGFAGRDLFGIWQAEIEQLAQQTGAVVEFFADDWDAHRHLTGVGLLIAPSESHLPNHATTHSVLRHAPPGFVRVTVQHGFECVGFRHSADHVRAHGNTASFGADIVCGWYGADGLVSMAPSQRSKLLVTGPTAVLQSHSGPIERGPNPPGIVCENLHSVRFSGSGDFKTEFVGVFGDFCARLKDEGRKVVLRPHPGGQYALKNKVPVPPNAIINNAPMYRLDLRRFAYGISAPSSVLIDMVLAGIPTAVWRDRGGDMDADTYAGLTTVSSTDEWIEFARAAALDPSPFLELQSEFLKAKGMPRDPEDVYWRYAQLFQMARRMEVRPEGAVAERERILFVANANVPTLQLSFDRPLAPLVNRGEFATELLSEQQLSMEPEIAGDALAEAEWVERRLNRFGPSIIVFCRYSGPASATIVQWARREGIPIVYHIDDDLMAIPPDIGQRKFAYHNRPERLETVRSLLESADVVYASTEKLRQRLLEYSPGLPVSAGNIYCSGKIYRRPEVKSPCVVGYMASADHAHNLQMVLPAIEQLLERNPHVRFELFGSIPVPSVLERFDDRVSAAPSIADYGSFLEEFAKRRWDIGICPLVPIDFNLMKADTKWVEYTCVGAAVVASSGTVYDQACAQGCGILADSADDWLAGLELLANDDKERLAVANRAQEKLRRDYNVRRLREQVLSVFDEARAASKRRPNGIESEDVAACLTE